MSSSVSGLERVSTTNALSHIAAIIVIIAIISISAIASVAFVESQPTSSLIQSSTSQAEAKSGLAYQTGSVSLLSGSRVTNDNEEENSWIGITIVKNVTSDLLAGKVLGIHNTTVTTNGPTQSGYWVETYYVFNVSTALVGNDSSGLEIIIGLQGGVGETGPGQYINITFGGLQPLVIGQSYILATTKGHLIAGPSAIFTMNDGMVKLNSMTQSISPVSLDGFKQWWNSIPSSEMSSASVSSSEGSIYFSST